MASPTHQTTRFLIQVDEAIASSRFDEALRLVLNNIDAFPDDAPLRERIAHVLAAKGRKREAIQILELVARHWANSGQPARCLASIKQMEAIQPNANMISDHFSALYSIRSPYLSEHAIPEPIPGPYRELDTSEKEPGQSTEDLLIAAVTRATAQEGMASQPQKDLPPLSLLSLLPTDTLRRVLDSIHYEIVSEPEAILTEGVAPRDLIWTVTPNVMTRHDEEAFYLPSGSLLGLSSLAAPRGATAPSHQTVSALRSAELLRLSKDDIERLDVELGDVSSRLAALRRHALTERLVVSHDLFVELDPQERTDLIGSFIGLHIKQGEHLIRQSTPSPGLYIILEGQVDIVRRDEAWEITIATLEPGEIFGEIGLVSDKATVAGVVAATPSILLFLSKEDFDEIAQSHPAVAKYAVELANARIEEVHSTLSASDLAEIE